MTVILSIIVTGTTTFFIKPEKEIPISLLTNRSLTIIINTLAIIATTNTEYAGYPKNSTNQEAKNIDICIDPKVSSYCFIFPGALAAVVIGKLIELINMSIRDRRENKTALSGGCFSHILSI